jgi:hypothetical protein
MNVKEIKVDIKRFDIGSGFFLDITETDTMYDAYIFRDLTGIKQMVLCAEKKDFTLDSFIQLVNTLLPDTVSEYSKKYRHKAS